MQSILFKILHSKKVLEFFESQVKKIKDEKKLIHKSLKKNLHRFSHFQFKNGTKISVFELIHKTALIYQLYTAYQIVQSVGLSNLLSMNINRKQLMTGFRYGLVTLSFCLSTIYLLEKLDRHLTEIELKKINQGVLPVNTIYPPEVLILRGGQLFHIGLLQTVIRKVLEKITAKTISIAVLGSITNGLVKEQLVSEITLALSNSTIKDIGSLGLKGSGALQLSSKIVKRSMLKNFDPENVSLLILDIKDHEILQFALLKLKYALSLKPYAVQQLAGVTLGVLGGILSGHTSIALASIFLGFKYSTNYLMHNVLLSDAILADSSSTTYGMLPDLVFGKIGNLSFGLMPDSKARLKKILKIWRQQDHYTRGLQNNPLVIQGIDQKPIQSLLKKAVSAHDLLEGSSPKAVEEINSTALELFKKK